MDNMLSFKSEFLSVWLGRFKTFSMSRNKDVWQCINSSPVPKKNSRMTKYQAPLSKYTGPSFEIIRGPSKFDLMTSLFVGEARERLSFRLHIGDNRLMDSDCNVVRGEVNVVINGAERTDGSGESWHVLGYVVGCDAKYRTIIGDYNTHTRTGQLTFKK